MYSGRLTVNFFSRKTLFILFLIVAIAVICGVTAPANVVKINTMSPTTGTPTTNPTKSPTKNPTSPTKSPTTPTKSPTSPTAAPA